ncbi:MAG: Gfo/Idh/MocA family oxidoreductase [Candidatus Firestonebacteria bacterium]|nr:Gfo/Idh/MocA family oxidoreductase [Candidatus Firestonebacteria bacterium]
MLKVGIIGFGKMGRKHLESFKRIPGVSICGIFDASPGKIQEAGLKTCPDYKHLIKECDVICIATPTDTHKQYILEAIAVGRPVFVEKPLCRTVEEAEEVMQAVKKYKAKVMVGHVVRYFNQYAAIKKAIADGCVGKPAVARITRCSKFPKASNNWFNSREKSGGVILDLMIHDIDFLIWCFGDVERVYAKDIGREKIPNMDYALAVIRFKNGVIAHLEASWALSGGFRARVEVAGTEGLVNYDSRHPASLKVEHSDGNVIRENPVDENANQMEIREFVEYVLNDELPKTTLHDAYEALKVSLAALESVKSGAVVKLRRGKSE